MSKLGVAPERERWGRKYLTELRMRTTETRRYLLLGTGLVQKALGSNSVGKTFNVSFILYMLSSSFSQPRSTEKKNKKKRLSNTLDTILKG